MSGICSCCRPGRCSLPERNRPFSTGSTRPSSRLLRWLCWWAYYWAYCWPARWPRHWGVSLLQLRPLPAGDLSQRVPEQGTEETRAVARSFNQMAANLEQAEQLRRNLMADVAHELRTPLTVIQGNLQALLDGVYPLERGEIATIYDETRLLSRLVADLRDLAQAEAGQLRLTMAACGPVRSADANCSQLCPCRRGPRHDARSSGFSRSGVDRCRASQRS